MPKTSKARAVGLNHIALDVDDIEEALTTIIGEDFTELFGAAIRPLCYSPSPH